MDYMEYTWSAKDAYIGGERSIHGVYMDYMKFTWHAKCANIRGEEYAWSIHGLHGVYTECQGCVHRGEGIVHGVYMDYMEYTWHAKDAYIGGEEYAMTSAPMLRQAVHWTPIRQCLPWHTQLLHQAWTLLAISCFRNGFVLVFQFVFPVLALTRWANAGS